MKINERTLVAYATATDAHTDKQGWLWKRGEVNKGFQKRYFILKGNLLFYFEKKGDKEPVGVVILEGCTVELAEEEHEKFAFKLVFHGEGKRTYVLGTESQDVMEEWMKVLACSSYDYMKLMVVELQQQLQELEDADRQAKAKMSNSASNGGIAVDGEPRPPPRTNPFSSRNSDQAGDSSKPRRPTEKSWLRLHHELGERIVKDRMAWIQEHEDSEERLVVAAVS